MRQLQLVDQYGSRALLFAEKQPINDHEGDYSDDHGDDHPWGNKFDCVHRRKGNGEALIQAKNYLKFDVVALVSGDHVTS